MYIKKSDIRIINSFLYLLKKQKINVSQAVLFGSYAKGTATFDSDIDIAVFSKRFGKDTPSEMIFLRKLALKVDSKIEPVPLPISALKDKYSTLIQEIKHYGKRLPI